MAKRPPPINLSSVLRRYWNASGFGMTPAQQRANARRSANLAIQDQVRMLRFERGREREAAFRENAAADVASQVLAQFRENDAATIRSGYEQAQQQVAGANQGLVNALQAAQQQAVSAGQQAAAASTGFTGDIGTGAPAVNAGVARQLGVAIPSEMLATEGAVATADALRRGSVSAATLSDTARNAMRAKLADITKQYGGLIREANAKRPSLVQESLQNLAERQNAAAATLISGLSLQGTLGENAFQAQLDTAKLAADQASSRARTANDRRKIRNAELAARGLAPDGRTLLPGFYRAPNGSIQKVPYGWRVGPSGGLVPSPQTYGGGSGSSSKVAKDRADYLQDLRADMLRAAKDEPLYGKNEWTGVSGPLVKRERARQFLMANFGTEAFGRYPGQRDRVRTMIEQILDSLGYPRPKRKKRAPAPTYANQPGEGRLGGPG